jgi:hypothetical protein
MIRDTDIWQTKECGCRLQMSVWEYEEDADKAPREMWVIREECPEHEARSAVVQEAIAKWQAGEPMTFDDEAVLEDVHYVDVPLEGEETP